MFHGLGLPGLVLLVGCPFIGEKDLTDRVDRDGDGYTVGYGPGADCDDNNSAIHPGAEEICDGVDNNCSGEADEGVTLSFHEDSDGDGYGHEFLTVEACAIGAGFVEDASDCDDGDPEVHPGVEEICDGKDNDCDETTADGGEEPYTFHLDLDGDGIGDVLAGDPDWSSSFSQLEASGSETQCTGSDSWAYCGAARLYSGADLVGSGSEYYGAQPIKSVYGPFSYEGFGAVVEPAGDLDGDGLTEILVSAPRAMDSAAGVRRAGGVYVLPGDGDFASIQNGGDLALATVTGDDNNDALGTSTSALGDLDQDGYADFGVGVPGVSLFSGNGFAGELPDKNGSVVVFLGPVDGVYKAQHADLILQGEALPGMAGTSLGSGDLDGDGWIDVAVGAKENSTSGLFSGAVYVYYAPLLGGQVPFQLDEADAVLEGESHGDLAGTSLVIAPDMNDDGGDDLVVGAIGVGGGINLLEGAVYVAYSGSL